MNGRNRIDTSRRTRSRMRRLAVLLCALGLVPGSVLAELTATVLWYAEQEAGTTPYKVRYIVTPQFLRSDDGDDGGDFLLYDRKTKQIFSVVREERRILQIDGDGTVPGAPAELALEVASKVDEGAPPVAGEHPLNVRLMAGERLCYMATVAPGLLPDARDAFQEFSHALAVQQVRSLENTPEEYRTPCFLLRYLYAAGFYLQYGLPLVDLDGRGDRRELLDYQTGVVLDDALFVLPDGYQRQKLGEDGPTGP